jgi:ketosteroid isomerase-like protein
MAALEGRVYRGPEGIREWFEHMREDWEVFETHPEEFHDLGDRVLAFGRWQARARGSGIELNIDTAAWLAQVRDGRIFRWRTFTDRDEAIEAAGFVP